jgi:phosphopantothenoylcysteine decarboxylase/phosphopantothenate--cysteine ligase
MGIEIAAAAWRRGARVQLVAGPVSASIPAGLDVTRVETTDEMASAVGAALPTADVLVMAAAPADFRPAVAATTKIKKRSAPASIELAHTSDILQSTRDRRKPNAVIVGFALETNDVLNGGREKLAAKGLDLIVVNDATEAGAGFGVDTNRVTLISRTGDEEVLPLMDKRDVAEAILDRVEALRRGT